jgi:hypothetical protein
MHMVFYVVKLLNYFPVKGGIMATYGPKAIMSGKVLDFFLFILDNTVRSTRNTFLVTASPAIF